MTEKMIERVARAIAEEHSGFASMWEYHVKEARAAIQVIWEQVTATIPEGPLQGNGWDKQAERNGMVLVANMLRAILAEGGE